MDIMNIRNRRLETATRLLGFFYDAQKEGNADECIKKLSQMNDMGVEYKIFFNIETGKVSYLE